MAARHHVTTLAALPPGSSRAFDIAGQRVALFNVAGRVFAVGGTCPHHGAPLEEGAVEDGKVVCPWHGAEFDLASGQVLCPPAVENIASYPVIIEAGEILVEL